MNEAEAVIADAVPQVKKRQSCLPQCQRIDRRSHRYGRWFVLRLADDTGYRKTRWLCRCDCGTTRSVSAQSLANGTSISCGCISSEQTAARNRTHGKCKSRAYSSWQNMIRRCTNPTNPAYPRYGGRGIDVCPQWRHSFAQFFADMGERPKGQSIERIRNGEGYSPDNCKWATDMEQSRNRRSVRIIEYDGLALTITEWGRRLGNPWLVFSRLQRGWDEQRAVSTPGKTPPVHPACQAEVSRQSLNCA